MNTTVSISLPSIDDVDFTITAQEDHIPVRGNAMASGDDAYDRKVENRILRQLNNGNVWAWAAVTVTAEWNELEGHDHLGACSYRNEKDFKKCGYYQDMKERAYEELIEKIKALGTEIQDAA